MKLWELRGAESRAAVQGQVTLPCPISHILTSKLELARTTSWL